MENNVESDNRDDKENTVAVGVDNDDYDFALTDVDATANVFL